MTKPGTTLITGATGFIGSALAHRMAAEGVDVCCLVRRGRPMRPELLGIRGLEILELDSFSTEALRRVLGRRRIEVVCHLAAYGVDPRDEDPELAVDVNVALATRLLTSLAGHPLRRFIHTGTCSEYGQPPAGQPITEAAPISPTSVYGASKAASVMIANAVAERLGIPLVTLRLFGVFGPGEAPHRLVPYLVTRLRRNEEVDLTPGEQVRDVLYVDDVADAFLAAASASPLLPYHVYNVCSGRSLRVRDMAEMVADAVGKPRRLLGFGKRPYRRDEPMWMVGAGGRFAEATAWSPKVTFLEGLRRMLATESFAPANRG